MKQTALLLGLGLLVSSNAWAEMKSVRVKTANFRENPSMHADVLFTADRHYPVRVIERKQGWTKVRDFEGEVAWVAERLLNRQPAVVVTVPAPTCAPRRTDEHAFCSKGRGARRSPSRRSAALGSTSSPARARTAGSIDPSSGAKTAGKRKSDRIPTHRARGVRPSARRPRLRGGSMMAPDKPRLLGRGIPPSQPAPQHLAPASLLPEPKPAAPKALIIAAAIAAAVIAAGALAALVWFRFLAPTPASTTPVLGSFAREATSASPVDIALATGDDLRLATDIVKVERVWIDGCQSPGPQKTPADQCDRQPFFERALVKAIVENGGCAPERPKDESISYALEIHHRQRKTRLFVGRSGTLRAGDAKAAVECVERSLPQPDWDSLPHEHTRYVIGVLATYPAEKRQ